MKAYMVTQISNIGKPYKITSGCSWQLAYLDLPLCYCSFSLVFSAGYIHSGHINGEIYILLQSLSGPLAWLSGGYFGVLNIIYEVSVILCWCAVAFVFGYRR
jgi:hypothetical protein